MKVLSLGGETFRCIDSVPLGLVFDLAEAMGGGEEGSMAMVAGIAKAIRTIVVKDDRARLKAVLDREENAVTFDELNNAMGSIMEEYGKRPTKQLSPLPSGRDETMRPSKVVSLYRGTVETAETSTRAGKSAAS